MPQYHLKNIRTLLREGFSDDELRQFCYDNAVFRPVLDQLASHSPKAEVINQLVQYAERQALMDRLLKAIKELNPHRYELHQPYLTSATPSLKLSVPSRLNLPLARLIGLAVLVLCLGLVGVAAWAGNILGPAAVSLATSTPTPGPTAPAQMRSPGFHLAVAGFAGAEQSDQPEQGVELARYVTQLLDARFKEIKPSQAMVWGPNEGVPAITGQTEDDQGEAAVRIADQFNADAVLYGTLSSSDEVIPRFKLAIDSFKDLAELDEIISQEGLGAPLPNPLAVRDYGQRQPIDHNLTVNVEILVNILDGLSQYYSDQPDYAAALASWEKADIVWTETQGKHVLYVLLGNAAGRTGDLGQAKKYLEKAQSIKPDYANAYLGVANIYCVQAVERYRVTKNPADIDLAFLDQGIATYEETLHIAYDSPPPNLISKVKFGLGECYLARSQTGDQTTRQEYLAKARNAFNEVILDYAKGDRPRLRERAGLAHGRLGVMYLLDNNLDCALKEYQTAVPLLPTNSPDQDLFEKTIKELDGQADPGSCSAG